MPYSPLMALLLVRNVRKDDPLVKSYASTVAKLVESSSLKMPMQFLVDINGELGFIFTGLEIVKVVDEYKFSIVMKFTCARSSIDNIKLNVVKKWGLLKIPMINFMDDYHVFIQMKNEHDFVHGSAREGRILDRYSFLLFKTRDFELHR